MTYQVDAEQIRAFFNVLSSNPEETFSGWFCDKDGTKPIKGGGSVFRKGNELIEEIPKIYSKFGATFHVALNRMSDKGRSTEHVQAVRVLCLDLDRVIGEEELETFIDDYDPVMVVESSPGKYHLYWKIQENIPFEIWKTYQLGIAHGMDGDKTLAGLSHTIRVPGIPRLTKNDIEFVPRIVVNAPQKELTFTDLQEKFPWAEEEARKAEKEKKAIRDTLQKVRNSGKMSSKAAKVLGQGRNTSIVEATISETVSRRAKWPNDPSQWLTEESAVDWAVEFAEGFEVNGKPPLQHYEIKKTALSGFRIGERLAEENVAKKAKEIEERQILGEFKYDYSDPELARNRFTDPAILRRVVQRFGDSILYDPSSGILYAFDPREKVWRKQNNKNSAGNGIYHYVDKILNDVIDDPEFGNELCKIEGAENADKRKSMERQFKCNEKRHSLARSILTCPELKTVHFGAFDTNLEELYCANGVLNMRTGELRDPRPSDMLLFKTSVDWNPDADTTQALNFFKEVFAENEDTEAMVKFVCESFGYTLSGRIDEQKIYCHFGQGSNGKSKVLDILNQLLGDYGVVLPSDDLVSKKNSLGKDQERIGSKIEGKRCAVVDDLTTVGTWNGEIIKSFSTEILPARRLYGEPAKFSNRCKCHVGLNKAPPPDSANHGFFRRMLLIPYRRTFEGQMDSSKAVVSMIKSNLPAFLKLFVLAYQGMIERGTFEYPTEVIVASEEYRNDNSPHERILKDLYRTMTDKEQCTASKYATTCKDILDNINSHLGLEHQIPINSKELGSLIRRLFNLQSKPFKRGKDVHRGYDLVLKDNPLS